MEPATIAAVQFEPEPGDVEANLDAMAGHLGALASEVEMAVFPELGVTGYDLTVAEREAEPVPGPLTDRLVELAAEYDVHLVAGLPERAGGDIYNDLVYAKPGGLAGSYRKQRLWGDETETFVEGEGPTVVETWFGRVGLLVCYDLNFPEITLAYANAGVDILAVSAAWRTDFLDDWELLLRARALDGTSYVVASNHVGDQRGRDHGGHSGIAGPDGTKLASSDGGPGQVTAAVTPTELTRARERNPVLAYRERRS